MSRTELTGTGAEFTETENLGCTFGLHSMKTELSPVYSVLALGYPNGQRTE